MLRRTFSSSGGLRGFDPSDAAENAFPHLAVFVSGGPSVSGKGCDRRSVQYTTKQVGFVALDAVLPALQPAPATGPQSRALPMKSRRLANGRGFLAGAAAAIGVIVIVVAFIAFVSMAFE